MTVMMEHVDITVMDTDAGAIEKLPDMRIRIGIGARRLPDMQIIRIIIDFLITIANLFTIHYIHRRINPANFCSGINHFFLFQSTISRAPIRMGCTGRFIAKTGRRQPRITI